MDERAATSELARRYAAALRDYVSGAGEAALTRAYELGRAAASEGLGILDLAMMRGQAVGRLPLRAAGDRTSAEMTAQFLAECLSPFEMTLRSYQANARLLGLSETLAQQNAEIDRAREQLRTILDATTAVIYLKDADGHYLFVNRQFEETFGVGREEVIGKRDADVLPAAVAAPLGAGDAGVLEARAPRQVEETLTARGEPRTFLSLKFPLIDPAGAPYGICCVATDITERNRAEDAVRRAIEAAARERQLHRAIEARDEFLTVASHELRTPLTSLELQVQMLQRIGRTSPDAVVGDPRVQSKCDAILKQVERMAVLVRTLIDVAKITSGRVELCRERLELCELVRDAVAGAADPIRRSGSEVRLRLDAPVEGMWDRPSLEAAVAHLLSNAVKFGAGKPIDVAVSAADGRAILTVRDAGIGISVEDQERIFDRFARAVSERHFGGFGVGLWLARQAVEAHGGTIRVESERGRGSEFTIELPLGIPAPRPG